MDASHIILGDHGNTMLMQPTEVKEISICSIGSMRPITLFQKSTKEKESKFIPISNQVEFLVESKETKQRTTLVVKEEVNPPAEIPKKMRPLWGEFKGVVHKSLFYSHEYQSNLNSQRNKNYI